MFLRVNGLLIFPTPNLSKQGTTHQSHDIIHRGIQRNTGNSSETAAPLKVSFYSIVYLHKSSISQMKNKQTDKIIVNAI